VVTAIAIIYLNAIAKFPVYDGTIINVHRFECPDPISVSERAEIDVTIKTRSSFGFAQICFRRQFQYDMLWIL
jgi:hypothetical protein